MTNSNTDRMQIPDWETATCILLRIASSLFYRWVNKDIPGLDDPDYKAWQMLRVAAARFLVIRSTVLVPASRESLVGALDHAHRSHHESVRTDLVMKDVEHCECGIANDLRSLALICAEERECIGSHTL